MTDFNTRIRELREQHLAELIPGTPVHDNEGDSSTVVRHEGGYVYTQAVGYAREWRYRPHELTVEDDLCPHGFPPEFCGNCHEEDGEA